MNRKKEGWTDRQKSVQKFERWQAYGQTFSSEQTDRKREREGKEKD